MKIALIALAVLFVFRVVRRARCRRLGHVGGCRGRWGHHGAGGRGPWSRKPELMVGMLRSKLSLNDEQEAVIREQIKLFRARLGSLDVALETRNRLAGIMRSESYDENQLGELFVSHDDALRTLRLELVERLAAVHAALDPIQRETLAQLLEKDAIGGPYRGGM